MENFNSFRIDNPQMKNILGGKKVVRKIIGTMRGADGKLRDGVYISSFDTETQTYTYYDMLGKEVYCP